jgi:hypothetical protein
VLGPHIHPDFFGIVAKGLYGLPNSMGIAGAPTYKDTNQMCIERHILDTPRNYIEWIGSVQDDYPWDLITMDDIYLQVMVYQRLQEVKLIPLICSDRQSRSLT